MYTKQIAKPGETTKICIAAPLSVSNEMRQVSSTKRQGDEAQEVQRLIWVGYMSLENKGSFNYQTSFQKREWGMKIRFCKLQMSLSKKIKNKRFYNHSTEIACLADSLPKIFFKS